MNEEQANRALRPAVILWTFAGLVGIPLAVYFDLLGGWRWPPCVQRAAAFLHKKNVTVLQVQRNLRSNDGERVFCGGHLLCARHQLPHPTRQLPLVCSAVQRHARLGYVVSRVTR